MLRCHATPWWLWAFFTVQAVIVTRLTCGVTDIRRSHLRLQHNEAVAWRHGFVCDGSITLFPVDNTRDDAVNRCYCRVVSEDVAGRVVGAGIAAADGVAGTISMDFAQFLPSFTM